MTIEQLEQQLRNLGYNSFKYPTKKSIIVYVDGNRHDAIKDISLSIPAAIYNPKPLSNSSLGCIEVDNLQIFIKPLSKQNRTSSYTANEDILVDRINLSIDLLSCPLHIILDSGTRQEKIENVIKAEAVGTNWAGRNKADVKLTTWTGETYNISVKMDNAAHWESANRYYKLKARYILQHLLDEGKVQLIEQEHGNYKISPNVAIQATEAEARDVVFGNDIENQGCVVVRTFSDSDFGLDLEDPTLTIRCSDVIKTLENIDLNNDVWFLIRNDSTHGDAILPGYKGLRVTAINSKLRRKTQYMVDRECRNQVLTQDLSVHTRK